MKTIYIVDLEPVETRYTAQWKKFLPEQLTMFLGEEDYNVQVISGGEVPQTTTPGAFLNFAGTNSYKSQQMLEIASLVASGTVTASAFSAQSKAFNIPHPTRENRRLVHGCLEGPEYGVYTRGRLTNKKEIILPTYWKGLVDWTTITVNLTPIGSHQHLIVKRFDEEKVYLQSNGGMPIDCFYHVYAERMDIPRIEIEPEVDTES